MNSLNLRQIDGGNVIKQADFGSNLSFELLDERRRKIPELDGQTATIRLIKGDNISYQTESQVVDGTVSFKFDRVLEKGIYVLEIVAGNYVFPSNNMVKITIEKTAGNYKPENMVKTDLVELQGKITALEQREHDVNQELLDVGQKQTEMTKRIEILESREDHDTIYDDTDIKQSIANVDNKMSGLSEKVTTLEERPIVDTALTERVEALERKEDKDTVYDDSNLKAQIVELESKLQSLNTVRRAPTSYTLDRTTTPWTIWFDNGCGMTIPEYGTTASIYGYGQGQNAYNNNFSAYPLPPTIMSVSHGTLTIEKIKTIEGACDFWASGITIINPIRDRNDYDWTNARFNKASLDYAGDPYYSYKYVRQQYFIRTMYELGIWSESDVEGFGAVKK
ncbi:hypothetical protein V4S36_11260 [Enterococcus cecorum]|uniref:hypothetical protein n=1 Tax=Enterococcus cecorum TaxID=44008 RepID=UPI00326605A3